MEEGRERLSQSGKRRASFSRSASKIFARTKISDNNDKKDEMKSPEATVKITIGQPQWQHRTAEDLLSSNGNSIKEDDKKITATASGGWKRVGVDDWKNEDAFDDEKIDKKKEKKKGILGRLIKKDKKSKK